MTNIITHIIQQIIPIFIREFRREIFILLLIFNPSLYLSESTSTIKLNINRSSTFIQIFFYYGLTIETITDISHLSQEETKNIRFSFLTLSHLKLLNSNNTKM